MKGRVIFWFHLNPTTNAGYVMFKLYGQQCQKCNNGKYEHAMWYPEEVVKVSRCAKVKVKSHGPDINLVSCSRLRLKLSHGTRSLDKAAYLHLIRCNLSTPEIIYNAKVQILYCFFLYFLMVSL